MNKLLVVFLLIGLILFGLMSAPFDWESLDSRSVPVDAIPDIGENQQVVYRWEGNFSKRH
jgi:Cu(I)/Ag(I) efflux system membrane protein CusA/SilA